MSLMARGTRPLRPADLSFPIARLEDFLNPVEERRGVGPVEGAVVPRQGEHANRVDGDRFVPELVGDNDRLALHPVGTEDGDLGLVDNRELHHRAVLPGIGQREGPTAQIVGRELLRAGAAGDIRDVAGDLPQTLAVDVLHDRSEQPLEIDVDRNRHVDLVVDDQVFAAEAGVEMGEITQRVGNGTSNERQVGERETLFRLPCALVHLANLLDPLVVDLHGGEDVRRGRLRHHHVFGGALADVVERHDLIASTHGWRGRLGDGRWCSGRCSGRGSRRGRSRGGGFGSRAGGTSLDDLLNVVAGDAAAQTGSGDLARIETVVGDQSAHNR